MENLVTHNATYFSFEHANYLLLILLCPIILALEYNFGRKSFYSLQKLRRFIDAHLIKHIVSKGESKRKAYLRLTCLFLFVIFLAFALANPRWDFTEIESYKPNTNVIFLLDISRSMLARDEKPNRLERAKQEISDIMGNIENANFALVVFANQAHVVSPITDDKENLNYLLPSVSTDLVSIQGSNVNAAVKTAENLVKAIEGGVNYFVVLSDGGFENLKEFPVDYKKAEIISYGFGSSEGAPITKEDGTFLKENDKIVLTKLEQNNLEYIAGEKSNFIKATYLDDDVEKLKSKILAKTIIEKSKFSNMRVWNDRFYIFIILAMLCVLPFFAKGARFPAIIFLLLMPLPVKANPDLSLLDFDNIEYRFFNNKNEQAEKDFQNKKYKQSQEKFSSKYNKGVALYRDKNYSKAEEFFAKGKSLSSLYNLGNAQLRQLKAEEAIKSYEAALKINPKHQDTKFNLEIAKKILNKQQQEQKKNEQDKKNDRDKENDKKDENKNDKNSPDNNKKNNDNQDDKTKIDFKNKNQQSKQNQKDIASIKKQNELEIKADKIFKKINSDPEKLMKNQFKMQEVGVKPTSNTVRPW